MNPFFPCAGWRLGLVTLAALAGCSSPPGQAPSTVGAAPAPVARPAAPSTSVTTAATATAPAAPARQTPLEPLVAPAPARFETSIARAGQSLFAQAAPMLGNESRVLVIDPLIDANTAQPITLVCSSPPGMPPTSFDRPR